MCFMHCPLWGEFPLSEDGDYSDHQLHVPGIRVSGISRPSNRARYGALDWRGGLSSGTVGGGAVHFSAPQNYLGSTLTYF